MFEIVYIIELLHALNRKPLTSTDHRLVNSI